MPKDIDIINESSLLGLTLYRMNEQNRTNQARLGAKVQMVNGNSYTIEFLLSTGAIANDTQNSFEDYLAAISEVEMNYSNQLRHQLAILGFSETAQIADKSLENNQARLN
jgi:hypothetical protein